MNKPIDTLIELYYSGETSLAEEQELKKYFASRNVADKHLPYAPLFKSFDEEKKQAFEPVFSSPKRNRRIVRLTWISGVAASIVLALLLIPKQQQETFMVVKGQKIYDTEMAISKAEEKLNAITARIATSLEPIERADRNLENALQPLMSVDEQ